MRLILFPLIAVFALAAQPLPQYTAGPKVAGTIRIWGHGAKGKDFIETLARNWEAGFHKYQPEVKFENKLAGTASAIGALYTGTGDLALLGREIWPSETMAFREVRKYAPTEIEVVTGSYNIRNKDFALVVYVHQDNPLQQLSLAQVKEVFGCGSARTWGDLGVKGERAHRPVHVYGFEISRGFGYYFQQKVFRGDFKWNPGLVEFADQKLDNGKLRDAGQRILDALAQDPDGIAYSSALYECPGVKAIALSSRADGGPYVLASKETVQSRAYPLTRVISMFLDRAPQSPVRPEIAEFLRYVLSREGQQTVIEDGGYSPLTMPVIQTERKKLE